LMMCLKVTRINPTTLAGVLMTPRITAIQP